MAVIIELCASFLVDGKGVVGWVMSVGLLIFTTFWRHFETN